MNKELIKECANRMYPIVGDYNTRRYGSDRMNEYIIKETAEAIMLSNGMILRLEKPSIETRFCFHDEGPQYYLYKHLHSKEEYMKAYFMNENLERLDSLLKGLEENEDITNKSQNYYVGFYDNKDGTASITFRHYIHISDEPYIEEGLKKHELEPNFIYAQGQDRINALEAVKTVREAFYKRLETWWKKYGAEKLHTWTYWADA